MKKWFNKLIENDTSPTLTSLEIEGEEWIWIEGYKGTDKDMKCRDFQYELNKTFTMDKNQAIITCASGFHLSLELTHVYTYYPIENNNRFFKVKALVKKIDYERALHSAIYPVYYMDSKLAAKSIIFIEELNNEIIFQNTKDLSPKYYDLARQAGKDNAINASRMDKLKEAGYSEALSTFILSHYKFDKAMLLANETSISQDMKIAIIFTS